MTAQDIINRAYSLLGVKAAGESLSAEDAQYALDVLNGLIDSWNTQRLFIVTVQEAVANVGTISATVGPGGTFNTTRPVDVENGAYSRVNGVDYSIQWIDRVTYDRLALKTTTSSFPQYAYFDRNLPSATVFFYPAPLAAVEIHLQLQVPLTAFADLSTSYDMAPGYRRALEYSLAEELSPGIRGVDALLMRQAANARRAIRRTNVDVPQMNADLRNVRFNIYAGV